MAVRAVAFDLDDTLLRDDRTVSDESVRIIRRAAAAGIHILPASGRAQHSMEALVNRLGCASMYIACNGAELWSPAHRLISRVTMDVELSREVARFGREHSCYAQTYYDNIFYYSARGKWADSYAAASLLQGVYVGDLEAFIDRPTSKILMSDEPSRIAELLIIARQQFAGRLNVVCSKPYFLEFNPIGADKGSALLRCGQLLGFSMEEAAAFGDSLNDLSMLTAAGHGVCMANARDDVKQLVAHRCLSNNDDGVARYIESHFLPKEALS